MVRRRECITVINALLQKGITDIVIQETVTKTADRDLRQVSVCSKEAIYKNIFLPLIIAVFREIG
jgi:hypothetical protein